MSLSVPRSRPAFVVRKLLAFLCGCALFVGVAGLLALWAAGRFSPRLLSSMLASRTGATLAIAGNDTNLLTGRVAYAGLTITNPTRWQERDFLKVRSLRLDLDPWSFVGGETRTFRRVDLDIEHLTIVGKADYLADNNAKDIGAALKGAAEDAASAATGPPSGAQPFQIGQLRIRVSRITIIAGDGTPGRRLVVDLPIDYVFEAQGITDRDFDAKVSRPMGAQALQVAADKQPALLVDLARTRLRKSVTELLLETK